MESALEIQNYVMDRKRILVVDDYPQIRNMIREALEKEGDYEVTEAGNGLEALNLLKKKTYDIVITDVMMPIMGGIDLLEGIKEVQPTVVTIMMTAYPAVETSVCAMKKGAIDFIRKPFSLDELVFKVNLYLRKRQALSEGELERNIKSLHLQNDCEDLSLRNYIYDAIENSFGDNDYIFEDVVELAMKVVGGKDCELLLYDAEGNQFNPHIVKGIDSETYCVKILPQLRDVLEKVAHSRESVIIPSVELPEISPSVICAPLMIRNQVFGVLTIRKKDPGEQFSRKELDYIQTLTKRASLNVENKVLYESLYRNLIDTFKSLVASIQVRDFYTEEHSYRVMDRVINMAKSMGCSNEDIESVRIAGMLHDIGKIAIPDRILLKPDKLTDYEYKVIKSHPGIGENILKSVMLLDKEREIILHHHERYDGRGYPDGLAGENIPFLSRLLAIADSFDAMTNNRPYRNSMSVDDAVKELRKNGNQQFDRHLVECFLQNI
jgi:putative nucleotidyltransferase with HDIG domain